MGAKVVKNAFDGHYLGGRVAVWNPRLVDEEDVLLPKIKVGIE